MRWFSALEMVLKAIKTYNVDILKERNTETVSETSALTDDQEEEGLRPGQEVITFKHACGACGHVIALHRHDFLVEADYQAWHANVHILCSNYYLT